MTRVRTAGEKHFDNLVCAAGEDLLYFGKIVEVPTWQALDVRGAPQERTHELTDYSLSAEIPADVKRLMAEVQPNLPWAENQFLERVGGPANTGRTYKEWPWYKGNVETHKGEWGFSHTYMDRYWPKRAVHLLSNGRPSAKLGDALGDLSDVVKLLAQEPTTRQAYLPVFFPMDTGAVHGERVPCSLGYLFLMRENKLNITYYIRSCDFYRHFRDDIYMTARLCQWVLSQVVPRDVHDNDRRALDAAHPWAKVMPGRLTMHIGSLHVFEHDLPRLRRECWKSADHVKIHDVEQ